MAIGARPQAGEDGPAAGGWSGHSVVQPFNTLPLYGGTPYLRTWASAGGTWPWLNMVQQAEQG